ncbi:MAG: FAD-dependent oxidoreductase [Ascidiaceihabitans sp.]
MDDTVTILGAGIVGICCALSLQDRGVRVRLIDRGAPGQETSYGNAGIISPWSIVPQASAGHRP